MTKRRLPPDPAPEAAVLGAMLTGALGLADVDASLEEAFHYNLHRSLYVVFLAALEQRRGRLPLSSAVALCDLLAAPGPLGAGMVELRGLGAAWAGEQGRVRRWTGFLPQLARGAPRRRGALLALEEVRRREARELQREAREWLLERDRERVRAAIVKVAQDAALAFLRTISDAGGVPYVSSEEGRGEALRRRYGVRLVEREAVPSPATVAQWIGGGA